MDRAQTGRAARGAGTPRKPFYDRYDIASPLLFTAAGSLAVTALYQAGLLVAEMIAR